MLIDRVDFDQVGYDPRRALHFGVVTFHYFVDGANQSTHLICKSDLPETAGLLEVHRALTNDAKRQFNWMPEVRLTRQNVNFERKISASLRLAS